MPGYWDDVEHRRAFVRDMQEDLGIEEAAQWKEVGSRDVLRREGGASVLKWYKGSLFRMLEDCLDVDGELEEVQVRKNVPAAYWADDSKARKFLAAVGEAEGIEDAAGWRRVTQRQLIAAGGAGLLLRFGNSVPALLAGLGLVEGEEAEGDRKARGFWKEKENQKEWLEEWRRQHDVRLPTDWAATTAGALRVAGGSGLLARYNNSLAETIRGVYGPDSLLAEVEDDCGVSERYWQRAENCRAFLDLLGERKGLRSRLEYSKMTVDDVKMAGGSGLLDLHGDVTSILHACLPYDPTEAAYSQHGGSSRIWSEKKQRQLFLSQVAEKYRWSELPVERRWQQLTKQRVSESGGSGLLLRYGGSVLALLADTWPEVRWTAYHVGENVGDEYWSMEENVRQFVRSLEADLGVEEPEDWYRVSWAQVRERSGSNLLRHMRMPQALALAYPQVRWDASRMGAQSGAKKASQRQMAVKLTELFPHSHLVASQ